MKSAAPSVSAPRKRWEPAPGRASPPLSPGAAGWRGTPEKPSRAAPPSPPPHRSCQTWTIHRLRLRGGSSLSEDAGFPPIVRAAGQSPGGLFGFPLIPLALPCLFQSVRNPEAAWLLYRRRSRPTRPAPRSGPGHPLQGWGRGSREKALWTTATESDSEVDSASPSLPRV